MARGTAEKNEGRWLPNLKATSGPIYHGIVEALADDIKAGRLKAGDSMPSQRDLADRLGINFTTVTRAYDEARSRGLIVARAGQGTFVRAVEPIKRARDDALLDLASNWPPIVPALSAIGEALSAIGSEKGAQAVEYRGEAPDPASLEAGRRWIANIFHEDVGDRLSISAGTRGALIAVLSQAVGPGGVMLTEALTWPAIKAVARLLGIKLIGVEMDDEGILPEAFEKACRTHAAKALYCTPTLQNPTGAVMSMERRRRIADIARIEGVLLVEDDAYGQLTPDAPPPIAALAPDVVIYVSGLAKVLASGLRIGYVVCPDFGTAQQITERLRFTMLVPPPIEAAIATRVILSGAANAILNEIRAEMKTRHHLFRTIVGNTGTKTFAGALHAFLTLPAKWPRAEFLNALSRKGVRAAPSDSFAISPSDAPNALRLSIGAPATADDLRQALSVISALYEGEAAFTSGIV